jgi:hypothetical protein
MQIKFDSRRVFLATAFATGLLPPADPHAFAAGQSKAHWGGTVDAPTSLEGESRRSFFDGWKTGRRDFDMAFDAGYHAALDDAAPTPPKRLNADLAGAWLDGWREGDQILVAREDAKLLEMAEDAEIAVFGSACW